MPDDGNLRAKVRVALQAGELPARLPDELLGGMAVAGRSCDMCGDSMDGGVEMELVFAGHGRSGRSSYYAHPSCLFVFEREIHEHSWTDTALPLQSRAAD
jgi:hypothetical protein